jgi:KaiC/GvpD/RAD55 family RecA-like ATPase
MDKGEIKMVRPNIRERWQVKTLEGRLSDKFDLLLKAREDEDAVLFDEFSKSIETLLIAVPEASNKLKTEKEQMIMELEKQYREIARRMDNAQDSISRDSIGKQLTTEVDWAFREEYSRLLMEIFYEYNLVPMQFIERTTVKPQHKQEVKPESTPEPEPEEQKQPKKKPKLMNKTKSKFQP